MSFSRWASSSLMIDCTATGSENTECLDVTLDCSLSVFLASNIPKEHAIILLSDLMSLTDRTFEMTLKTYNVFSGTRKGKERGHIRILERRTIYEKERTVENAAVCLSFLFFTNALGTKFWYPTPRRGEHWDYWCLDRKGRKNVVEVGGSSTKDGAKIDQTTKKNRFRSGPKIKEIAFISSVGFLEREHIVSRYC